MTTKIVIGNAELWQGDCLELMQDIPDGSVDCVIADPPFGTTSCHWDSVIPFEPMWTELKRITKPSAAIVLHAAQPFTSSLIMSNIKMFKYCLVWNKDEGKNPGLAKVRPMPSFEDLCVFGLGRITYNPQMEKGKPYRDIRKKPVNVLNGNEHQYGFTSRVLNIVNTGTRYPKSVITIKNPNRPNQHPTQKSVPLAEYLIRTYTNEGETVLDFCMGSGTTGVGCMNTNRKFIGIELNEAYFDISIKRIESSQERQQLFA